jgi:hypothetical protein
MEITKDLSFVGMIANASVVVQIILALLLLGRRSVEITR